MRRGPFCFYAFDLLWLDGTDLRSLALSGRKALLRKLLPRKAHAVRYVEHVVNGADLFRVICDRDMEGIVAKQASSRYTPEATTFPGLISIAALNKSLAALLSPPWK
jgi:bifunctional non-homologous end joining protein LigD